MSDGSGGRALSTTNRASVGNDPRSEEARTVGFRVLQEGNMPVSSESRDGGPQVQPYSRDLPLNANGIDGTLEILLVEDNPADARLTREVFEGGRLSTHLNVVSDGEQALAFLRQEGIYESAPRPKLVLLDLNLPRKDGREVLEELKADHDALPHPRDRAHHVRGAERHHARLRAAGELLHHEAARPRRVLRGRAVDRGLLARDGAPALELGLAMAATAEQQTKSFPVLLVEDNPGDARLVVELLSEATGDAFQRNSTWSSSRTRASR